MSRPKGTRTFQTRLNAQEKEKIIFWSRRGVPQVEIARRLGCERNTVLRQQKRLGCAVEYRRPVTEELRREVLGLHEQGLSSEPIAARVGVGARTVVRVLREAGITIKSRKPASPEKIAAIDAEIRSRTDFLCRIAKRHGVGLRTVRRRRMEILGPAQLKSTWPPLQSKFSQIDASEFVPTPEEAFLQLVRKSIDETAERFLRQGRNRAEVLASAVALKRDPSPIIESFEAGLRKAAYAMRFASPEWVH